LDYPTHMEGKGREEKGRAGKANPNAKATAKL
jgi:hypothetical protein